MGAFIGEYAQSGRLLDGAGLAPARRARVLTFSRDGACTVKHGPYRGAHELPAAMLLLKVKTREEGIGWAERYGKILGTGEIELGEQSTSRGTSASCRAPRESAAAAAAHREGPTSATRTTKQKKADLTRLQTEMTKAGVLVRATQLQPSAKAKRLTFVDNDLRVVDGPFSESKELVGGFAMLELPGVDEAIAVCRSYAAILGGTLEIDVRPLADPEQRRSGRSVHEVGSAAAPLEPLTPESPSAPALRFVAGARGEELARAARHAAHVARRRRDARLHGRGHSRDGDGPDARRSADARRAHHPGEHVSTCCCSRSPTSSRRVGGIHGFMRVAAARAHGLGRLSDLLAAG